MQFIETNGERIAYRTQGTGPALLLLHSLGASSDAWAYELEHLSATYQVVAPDCRGHGSSSHQGEITLDGIVDDLTALLDHLKIDQAHLLGLSMGGGQALRFYERHPGRVKSLILSDTFATYGRERAESRLADTKVKLQQITMEELGREYSYGTLMAGTPEEKKVQLAKVIGQMDASAYLETASACFMADLEHLLPQVKVPTLVLVGAQDNKTPPEWSQAMARAIPGARYEEVEGGAHLSNLDQPEAFQAVVTRFLKSVG